MIKNASDPIINGVVYILLINRGIGISNTISMSNTIKIIASKKKRIENGTRAL